jgi:GT2 family glycosyltransferase
VSAEPLVSVVIVTWNGAHLLPPCLEAVAAQDLPTGAVVTYVVDNASVDGTPELLARDYPWAVVVRSDRNRGFAGGNNLGIARATTPYVALLNNDAIPAPDWLRRSIDALERTGVAATTPKILLLPRFAEVEISTPEFRPGGADDRTLGVRLTDVRVDGEPASALWDAAGYGVEGDGWRWSRPAGTVLVPVPPDGSALLTFTATAEREKDLTLSWPGGSATVPVSTDPTDVKVDLPASLPRVDVLNNAGSVVHSDGSGADRGFRTPDRGQYDDEHDVFALCGNGPVLRRSVLDQVGAFDDDFFLYYEDSDLSWRLRSAGHEIRYVPEAVLRHHHSASSGEWSPVFTFHVERNRLLMLTKNAPAGMVLRQLAGYLRRVLGMTSGAVRAAARSRRPGPLRPVLLHYRVLGSYLRLLPVMLRHRRAIAGAAVVDRDTLRRRLVLR